MNSELTVNDGEDIKPAAPGTHSILKSTTRKFRVYFFQFFMLFLAVTAGFFAENLREEMSERKQSREYAKSMVDDLVRDTLNIRYHVSRLTTAIKTITELSDYVRGRQLKELNNTELYRLTSITWNPPFRWSRATIEQIKSSGSLRFFTNDSIVYYISQYDAWTLHLDQDNAEDQLRYLQAVERKTEVVDLNYPDDFLAAYKANRDSVVQTADYLHMYASKQLLAGDMNQVNVMVNTYLMVRDYCAGRIRELSTLVHDQSRLILLLKREYELDRNVSK